MSTKQILVTAHILVKYDEYLDYDDFGYEIREAVAASLVEELDGTGTSVDVEVDNPSYDSCAVDYTPTEEEAEDGLYEDSDACQETISFDVDWHISDVEIHTVDIAPDGSHTAQGAVHKLENLRALMTPKK